MSNRDDEKTDRTAKAEAAELRSFEAEARAQEAKSIASRALPKSAALVWAVLSAIVSVLAAVVGGTWWVSSYLSSKADASKVELAQARVVADVIAHKSRLSALEAQRSDDRERMERMERKLDLLIERVPRRDERHR